MKELKLTEEQLIRLWKLEQFIPYNKYRKIDRKLLLKIRNLLKTKSEGGIKMSIAKRLFMEVWWVFTILFMFLIYCELYGSFTIWGVIAWGIATFYVNLAWIFLKKK